MCESVIKRCQDLTGRHGGLPVTSRFFCNFASIVSGAVEEKEPLSREVLKVKSPGVTASSTVWRYMYSLSFSPA